MSINRCVRVCVCTRVLISKAKLKLNDKLTPQHLVGVISIAIKVKVHESTIQRENMRKFVL